MNTITQPKTHLLKGSLIFVMILASALYCTVQAQTMKQLARDYQFGFEGSFGVKSFTISSNIDKINQLNVIEEGATLGVVVGSKIARIRIRQGYYYSSSSVTQTVDEVRSSIGLNLYPSKFFTDEARLMPYITMGVERNLFKMNGFYGNDASTVRNYSVSEAPYLGKISIIQATLGAGLEYRIATPGHFVSFFGEARYGKNIRTNSSTELFSQTSLSGQMAVNIGISYGYSN
jgi:hypothetical protein